jgi:hypothetical protein
MHDTMGHPKRITKAQAVAKFYEAMMKVAEKNHRPQIMRNPILQSLGKQKEHPARIQ